MTTVMRKCKVCGAEYEYCHTFKHPIPGAFRWQDVACCPEQGADYLAEVIASRIDSVEEPEELIIEDDIDDDIDEDEEFDVFDEEEDEE